MPDRPIGIFDSGVGGLTVCKAIHDTMPCENIIYFGDTARFPYGTRSTDTIIRYSRQITGYLLSRGVKIIVIACNTSSAAALETLRTLHARGHAELLRHALEAQSDAVCARVRAEILENRALAAEPARNN